MGSAAAATGPSSTASGAPPLVLEVEKIETLLDWKLAITPVCKSWSIANPSGCVHVLHAGNVFTSVPPTISTVETELSAKLVTSACPNVGFVAIPKGHAPTVI